MSVSMLELVAKAIELRDTTDSLAMARAAIQAIADYYDNMASSAEAQGHNHIPYQNIAHAMKFELDR